MFDMELFLSPARTQNIVLNVPVNNLVSSLQHEDTHLHPDIHHPGSSGSSWQGTVHILHLKLFVGLRNES